MSCVMCHKSRVTYHVWHVTFIVFVCFLGQSGEAYRWRVCYQRGLPRLIFLKAIYIFFLLVIILFLLFALASKKECTAIMRMLLRIIYGCLLYFSKLNITGRHKWSKQDKDKHANEDFFSGWIKQFTLSSCMTLQPHSSHVCWQYAAGDQPHWKKSCYQTGSWTGSHDTHHTVDSCWKCACQKDMVNIC